MTAKETQMYRTVFWTLWDRAMVGWFGRMALKHVYYHMWNESPVQVQCMRQGAWGWCTGMTQKDGMRREVGGALRMGNTCTPVADSCQCMAKPIQYCKVISLQLKWTNLLKIKKIKIKMTAFCGSTSGYPEIICERVGSLAGLQKSCNLKWKQIADSQPSITHAFICSCVFWDVISFWFFFSHCLSPTSTWLLFLGVYQSLGLGPLLFSLYMWGHLHSQYSKFYLPINVFLVCM